jgi:hypothetical protein
MNKRRGSLLVIAAAGETQTMLPVIGAIMGV